MTRKSDVRARRRVFCAGVGAGVAAALGAESIALGSLLAEQAKASGEGAGVHHKPTARSVIFLFMSGGPSQVDTFDPKPELEKLGGRDVPESLSKLVPKIQRAGLKNLLPSPWKFEPRGESGLSISTLLPKTAEHADDLCVIRSMSHRNPVHGPGECVALTGSALGDRPCLGAWSIYGLGESAKNLPSFIAMNLHTDGMQHPQAAGWGTGFLPSKYQGSVVNPNTGIRDTTMPTRVSPEQRRRELQTLEFLNQRYYEQIGDSELQARLTSYQTAFEMQTSAPELFDLKTESAATHQLYGISEPATRSVGRACLVARRMVQRGVRFVQIRVGGWDAHGNIGANHSKMAARTDTPIAALLTDLKRSGLLDETLVVWGGEFGRTPTMEGRGGGRDHSPAAYSIWLAGGGVRGGQFVGQTDEIGYTVTSRPVKPTDLHATILHALGLESSRLTFDHHGLIESPLGVTVGGPVKEVFRNA